MFGPSRVAVMVDGCFWHSCPKHRTSPLSNAQWWEEKLRKNQERDRDTDERFALAGWKVIRVWEHENPALAAKRIQRLVDARRR